MSCHNHGEHGHCECHGHETHDSCGCGHSHSHKKDDKLSVPITLLGAILIAVSFIPIFSAAVKTVLLISATVICGIPVFLDALKALKNKEIGETVLLLIAVIAAILLGEFFEAAVVTVLFRVGEQMEEYASGKSRKSIESVFAIVSDTANLVMPDGEIKKIDADEIEKGNILAVMPHEIIPADGVVTKGIGTVDESSLTGESLPVEVSEGSAVRSGTVNGDSTLYI